MRRIYVFANCHVSLNDRSGGDIRCIEVMKRIDSLKKTIITSEIGKQIYKNFGLNTKYLITSKEMHVGHIYLTYFIRMTKSLFLKEKIYNESILYSSSDFLPDVLPAFVWKLKNKKVKWIALLHLLAPNPFYGSEQEYLSVKRVKLPNFKELVYKLGQLVSVRLMKCSADKIFVVNSEIKKYLLKKGIKEENIRIVDNGINWKEIQEIKPVKENGYDGIFVGRFHPQKGIFDLIKIWEIVIKNKKNCKLVLIGNGNNLLELKVKKEIEMRNLEESIEFLGIKDGDEKISIIKSGKIFLFPSVHESWGIVAAEAMACGLPVVAYNLPPYDDIYKKNILKVPIGDINQFAKIVLKLLSKEELRRNFGLKGRKYVQKYDWDKVAEKEIVLLASLHLN